MCVYIEEKIILYSVCILCNKIHLNVIKKNVQNENIVVILLLILHQFLHPLPALSPGQQNFHFPPDLPKIFEPGISDSHGGKIGYFSLSLFIRFTAAFESFFLILLLLVEFNLIFSVVATFSTISSNIL